MKCFGGESSDSLTFKPDRCCIKSNNNTQSFFFFLKQIHVSLWIKSFMFSMMCIHVLHFCMGFPVSSGVLSFHPTFQKRARRRTGYTKLPLGVCECVYGCVCVVIPFRVYSYLTPCGPGIDSTSTKTLSRIKWLLQMNE